MSIPINVIYALIKLLTIFVTMMMSDYPLLSIFSSQAHPLQDHLCSELITNYLRHYNSWVMVMSDYQLLSNTSSQAYPHQVHLCSE